MALALRLPAQHPAPGPTDLLKDALKDFETALTNDQRQVYQQACCKPGATSVITFVTQLDQDNQARARRCFAPRLLTFLNATRQFSDAVDTFVSSNPRVAGLVWGGVKTAILAASNVASYFEKVTDLIMRIGRFCPVYDDFGSLYPGAVGLQTALCRFYVTIIRLCIKIIAGSQQSLWLQILSPIANPFEAEFKTFVSQLEQDGREVELQLVLASRQADKEAAKLLELDRQQNSSNWKSVLQYQKGANHERAEAAVWRERQRAREEVKIRASIRDNLSPVDHEKPWKQNLRQRISNTAEWFAADSDFMAWRDSQKTAVLWCSGNLGTGKSVLVSNIIAHLSRESTPTKIVMHFFCRYEDSESVKARNILGSICQQLLKTEIESAKGDKLDRLHADTCDLDFTDVTTLISTRLDLQKTYYIILDGLDECESVERKLIAKALSGFAEVQKHGLKILCAGRPDTANSISFLLAPDYRFTLASKEIDADIAKYVDAVLDECLEDGRLKLGDPALILVISEALQRESQGMFLWTRLMIGEICAQDNDNAIRSALKNLPRELSEIFARKLARIGSTSRSHLCNKILQFCGVTRRPLTVGEFQEALGIELGQESLQKANLPNDIGGLLNSCEGLVYADEEECTVHYVHHGVRQHLYDLPGPHSECFDWPTVDKNFGLLCMTYLDFKEFRGQVDKVMKSVPIDPIEIGLSVLGTKQDLISRLARQMLNKNKTTSFVDSNDFKTNIQELVGIPSAITPRVHFHFLPYAKQNWIYHLQRLKESDGDDNWRLFCRCVEGEVLEAYRPWQTYSYQGMSAKLASLSEAVGPLALWATSHNHQALLSGDFRRPTQDLEGFWSMIETVTETQQEDLLELIVQNPLTFTKDTLASVLMMAIEKGAVKLAEVYLKAGADPNISMSYNTSELPTVSRTPLQLAASIGTIQIVELLLAYGADVNLPALGDGGRTALQVACERDHKDVIERLLEAGADIGAAPASRMGITAYQAAIKYGSSSTQHRLLDSLPGPSRPLTLVAKRDLVLFGKTRLLWEGR